MRSLLCWFTVAAVTGCAVGVRIPDGIDEMSLGEHSGTRPEPNGVAIDGDPSAMVTETVATGTAALPLYGSGAAGDGATDAQVDGLDGTDPATRQDPSTDPTLVPPPRVDDGCDMATLDCGETIVDTSGSVTISNWCSGTAPTVVIEAQANGPEVARISLGCLLVASGATLRLIGARPVIFEVAGDVIIDGRVDASADGTTPGAGGDWTCASALGVDGSGSSRIGGAGGGGGGFGSAGGGGGSGDGSTPGSGGAARGDATLLPLMGGCTGGSGGGCVDRSVGASGGGALQLLVSGDLLVDGSILANGGEGVETCGTEGGGTGGGSGGAVYLSAANIDVSGSVTVNGGRGGRGRSGGDGGAGSTDGSAPGEAGESSGFDGGGGGGGGYGRLMLVTTGACTGCP